MPTNTCKLHKSKNSKVACFRHAYNHAMAKSLAENNNNNNNFSSNSYSYSNHNNKVSNSNRSFNAKSGISNEKMVGRQEFENSSYHHKIAQRKQDTSIMSTKVGFRDNDNSNNNNNINKNYGTMRKSPLGNLGTSFRYVNYSSGGKNSLSSLGSSIDFDSRLQADRFRQKEEYRNTRNKIMRELRKQRMSFRVF